MCLMEFLIVPIVSLPTSDSSSLVLLSATGLFGFKKNILTVTSRLTNSISAGLNPGSLHQLLFEIPIIVQSARAALIH